ncbi:MAG: Cyclopropane-fatty-acyl-phospholipid synthase [Ktedonobacterales bacterium]|jgi:cyclopropane-fatty-acyl-phospholipid synthase|nr:MAG: Cyclopropane-fatty-acyl-phospholipid synthase [Ktedonobacterales bacterium]
MTQHTRTVESRPAAEAVPHDANQAVAITRSLLRDLFGPPEQRDFAVRLWDGSRETPPERAPRYTIALNRPGALRRIFLPPSELALGEAYLDGDFDIEGEIEAAVGLANVVSARLGSPLGYAALIPRLRALPVDDAPAGATAGSAPRGRAALAGFGARHTRRRDAAAIRYHYDVGNDFYALWLDQRMVYSCAYFPTGAEDLDTAQEAKLEHICRKLRLRPGERLLDIGCGWGGLVRYAAERYGVEALGVTLSEPQAALARERIAAAGLTDRCRVEVRDYRDLPRNRPFDKIVSVGMFEHVGRSHLYTYFNTAYHLLRPGGLFLNHGIAEGPAQRGMSLPLRLLWRPGSFVATYVFPDGELIPPGEALRYAEMVGFETRDVENLREHYTLTLRQWVRRLEAHREEAVRIAGERTYRVWRLYMAGAAQSFATGGNSLIQALFTKLHGDGTIELPPTRADLYA